MPPLEYFVVAESATVDQFTNRVSVFNVCDEIHASAFPIKIGRIVGICSWNAEEGDENKEFQIEVRVQLPEGKPRIFNANFTMPARRQRSFLTFEGIQVSRSGVVEFKVLLNGSHQATHTIFVYGPES